MNNKSVLKRFVPRVGIGNESERELWVQKTLKLIPTNSRILDAGAGTQRYRRFCTHLDYVSQDFGKYDGRGDSVGLQTGSFDYAILLLGVLNPLSSCCDVVTAQ